jgi:hypothetical protein
LPIATPSPRSARYCDVAPVDLRQARVAGAAGITAVIGPVRDGAASRLGQGERGAATSDTTKSTAKAIARKPAFVVLAVDEIIDKI